MLLIHGLSGYRQTYSAVVDHLVNRSPAAGKCEVFTVDLRGHGDSSHADLQRYSAKDYADDIVEFLYTLTDGYRPDRR